MVAVGSFGRMLVGGSSGGGEASPHGGSCATDCARLWRGFSGEIPVGSSDTDAVPPAGWHLSFLKGVCAGGNPRTSALVRAVAWLSFLKVLLGKRRFGARSVVVLLRSGRSGCGSPLLSRSAFVSILFLFFSSLPLALGVCLLPPQHFVIVGCIGLLLYLYSGATAYFVRYHPLEHVK